MKTENLSWFEALTLIRDGQAVTRAEWNDERMRVYFDYNGDRIPDIALMDYEEVKMRRNDYAMKLDTQSIVFLQNIYLEQPGQDPKKGYHPIQADFIATDWRIIAKPDQTEEPVSHEE